MGVAWHSLMGTTSQMRLADKLELVVFRFFGERLRQLHASELVEVLPVPVPHVALLQVLHMLLLLLLMETCDSAQARSHVHAPSAYH